MGDVCGVDDEDLLSVDISMLQQHAHCTFKRKKKEKTEAEEEKSLVHSLSKSNSLSVVYWN